MTEGGATAYVMSHHETSAATYEFKDSNFKGVRKAGGIGVHHNHHHHHHHRRASSSGQSVEGGDADPTDGTGSLTYSATSSVQSGAGESTDSSFADIMRVLDLQEDGPELAALMKKEGLSSTHELREKHKAAAAAAATTSGVSVASSLNYSTDGESALESALEGSHLLHTITGQPSDSYAFDGGGMGTEKARLGSGATPGDTNSEEEDAFSSGNSNIMFAPAEPAEVKRKKKDRRNSNNSTTGSSSSSRHNNNSSKHHHHHHHTNESDTPRAKNGSAKHPLDEAAGRKHQTPSPTTVTSKAVAGPMTPQRQPSTTSTGAPTRGSPGSANDTPTSANKKRTTEVKPDKDVQGEEEDAWYAKWWTACFPDAFRDLVQKR